MPLAPEGHCQRGDDLLEATEILERLNDHDDAHGDLALVPRP